MDEISINVLSCKTLLASTLIFIRITPRSSSSKIIKKIKTSKKMIEHESCEKNDRHEDIHSINLDF